MVAYNIYSPNGYADTSYDYYIPRGNAAEEEADEEAQDNDEMIETPSGSFTMDKLPSVFPRNKGRFAKKVPVAKPVAQEMVLRPRLTRLQTRVKNAIEGMKRFARKINDPTEFNYDSAKNGEFNFKGIGKGNKDQDYHYDIPNRSSAILVCSLLFNYNNVRVPPSYRRVKKVFVEQQAEFSNKFLYEMYEGGLDAWINMDQPQTRGRKKAEKQVKNPRTGRWIKKDGKTYKEIFGKIKLKKVLYDPLENYNTIEYEIDKYCVPSFLKQHLLKREYSVISDDLDKIKTPTYIELTEIMNKINYNLNVYITDKECIQEQTEYKKKLNIMIHDEHMNVLKNSNIEKKVSKVVEIDQDEYYKIKSELYTDSYKIKDGVKYKIKNRFKAIDKDLGLKSSYSKINIDFFNNCKIRPIRYIKNDHDNLGGFDINQCYYNILKNDKYVFPVQNGTEIIEIYDENEDYIEEGSYYYVEFKEDTEYMIKKMYGKKGWILGYVLKELKLDPIIKYKQVINHCVRGRKQLNHEYLDVIHYTGYLAKYETEKTINFECDNDEADAYEAKYKDMEGYHHRGSITIEIEKENGKKITNDIFYLSNYEKDALVKQYGDKVLYVTKPNFTIFNSFLLKKSGMYAYLSILQYARLQLYYIYKEAQKIEPNINVHKMYTDAIFFDKNMNQYIDKINISLKRKHGFSVKWQESYFKWDEIKYNPPSEPIIIDGKITYHEDLNKLLKSNISFCINARPGYGKSYMIKNKIIPFILKNDKKYILTTTTIKLAENAGCDVIHQLLLTKEASLSKIDNMFKNIDYLIIDESSLMSVGIINLLQYIKKSNNNLIIILVGDSHQCSYDETSTQDIMDTQLFYSIVDFNVLTIKWHNKARYSKEYDNFLTGILEYKTGKDEECIKYIKNYFKGQVKNKNDISNDKIILSYTNDKCKQLQTETNECLTVHKAQGETYNQKYSVYEIERMTIKIIYTALSRCSDSKLLSIYL